MLKSTNVLKKIYNQFKFDYSNSIEINYENEIDVNSRYEIKKNNKTSSAHFRSHQNITIFFSLNELKIET